MGNLGKTLQRDDGHRAAGLSVRVAQDAADLAAVIALRQARFGVGGDDFDALSQQIMIEQAGRLLATFRLRAFADGAAMEGSYSAQFYDLTAFSDMEAPALELGRFCLAEGLAAELDALRLAFAAMTRVVDRLGAALMFGCASFIGCALAPHRDSLALLADRVGQGRVIPRRSSQGIDLAQLSPPHDSAAALRNLPPLLRSYLAMGGWVGGQAVQDFDLGTIHVLTVLEISAVPPARAAELRALAAGMDLA